ncbi:MAG: hypothetical protein K6B68_13305 [Eubacterium sp.]|nr:hypothetical protein [Eubacterium sp.]
MIRNRQQLRNGIGNNLKISNFKVVLFLIPIFALILTTTFSEIYSDSSTAYAAGENDNGSSDSEDRSSNSKYKPDESGFVDYTGDVDTVTGEPIEVSETEEKQTKNVAIKDGSTYDWNNSLFIYKVTGGAIGVSVCDGMIVTSPVSFAVSGDINIAIFRNGSKYTNVPSSVSDPGTYVVLTWDNESEEQVMSFQIVASKTGVISQYLVPNGFTVMSVSLNGTRVNSGFGTVDMSKEGYYEVSYRCNATSVDYYLYVTIDHTPPDVRFDGLDSKNRAQGPVSIKGLVDGDEVYILHNDEDEIKLDYKNQITQSGNYHVVVSDDAGNYITKDFVIMVYLNVKGVFFFSLIVVIIIVVIIALYISRKRLRVR